MSRLTYAVITPARDETENLARLADALVGQELRPSAWVIVDTGSTDDTVPTAQRLASAHDWVVVERVESSGEPMRGGPIVRAFHAGLRALPSTYDLVVKLDADTSMEKDYFDRLAGEFERDERLGIAGGIAYELDSDGVWRQRQSMGLGVWGASRVYRRACLEEIMPLEERMGWDTIDMVSATVRGWHVRVFPDLPFLHHRKEGSRESSRYSHWVTHGRVAHYMGYRPLYLLVRIGYRMVRDPRAIGIATGYVQASLEREPTCSDAAVKEYVRQEQTLRKLPSRARQALQSRVPLSRTSPSSGA
jgi:biofilm PGA synthesis N-glycosyltransferase PgaC